MDKIAVLTAKIYAILMTQDLSKYLLRQLNLPTALQGRLSYESHFKDEITNVGRHLTSYLGFLPIQQTAEPMFSATTW